MHKKLTNLHCRNTVYTRKPQFKGWRQKKDVRFVYSPNDSYKLVSASVSNGVKLRTISVWQNSIEMMTNFCYLFTFCKNKTNHVHDKRRPMATCMEWFVVKYRVRGTSRGPVHTTPAEFNNTALFLRLGLLSTLIRHEHGAFRKSCSNRRNSKSSVFRFRVDRNWNWKR